MKLEMGIGVVLMVKLVVKSLLLEQVQEAQKVDEALVQEVHKVEKGGIGDFRVKYDVILEFRGRVCIPMNPGIKE